MVTIVGKHAFLQILREEGVEYLFGNPGSTELALMDALAVEKSPQFILGLHEGIVMSMAHGYGASTGKLSAVNLHAAPGLGNAMGMLYNIKKAGVPVLVTAGQQDISISIREPLLWDDIVTMARPLVKWSVEVNRLTDLPRIVRRAAKVALTPPMGPVFISLPGDILTETADVEMLGVTRIAPSLRGDAGAIAQAGKLISSAKKPMIFAGDSVCDSKSHAALVSFAELLGAPVFLEAMCDRAAFPTSHPLFAGAVARLGPAVRTLVDQHDLIISVGGDLFTESLATGVDPIPPGKTIVHIDNNPWELGKNYETQCAIFADPSVVLPELTEIISREMPDHIVAIVEERRAAIEVKNKERRNALVTRAKELSKKSPVAPISVLHAMGEILPDDVILVEESLSSNAGLTDLIALDDEISYFGLRGGGIGAGLPMSIGAKIGNPGRPVVAFIGDGSSMFSIQSLWTAMHYNLAVTFVIINNSSYRILKQRTLALDDHAARTGKLIGMDLTDPAIDFQALARSVRMPSVRTETIAAFRDALSNALGADGPRLIEVVADGTI